MRTGSGHNFCGPDVRRRVRASLHHVLVGCGADGIRTRETDGGRSAPSPSLASGGTSPTAIAIDRSATAPQPAETRAPAPTKRRDTVLCGRVLFGSPTAVTAGPQKSCQSLRTDSGRSPLREAVEASRVRTAREPQSATASGSVRLGPQRADGGRTLTGTRPAAKLTKARPTPTWRPPDGGRWTGHEPLHLPRARDRPCRCDRLPRLHGGPGAVAAVPTAARLPRHVHRTVQPDRMTTPSGVRPDVRVGTTRPPPLPP